ncbi:hypothetical protein [Tychonema sp. LEGE 07203]|uniref:ISAzo13-like element transposase-related protein n=1 Tax=Tychonema sp. LEGE 07203 TaxID=1828671 RepID=UPI00188297E7|nr:hypothetical protein [Tychonema sp. LEGE 07203]
MRYALCPVCPVCLVCVVCRIVPHLSLERLHPLCSSKYNPIEHGLFPHITRACQGVIFTSLDFVKSLREKIHTNQDLSVVVNVVYRIYKIARKVTND